MTISDIESDGVAATLHRPPRAPRAVAVLAHGAGGNRDTAILRAYAEELCDRGLVVARIDLPYRQRRPKGPPSPSTAAADRAGIAAAIARFRGEADGPLIIGGHSYGGRQASMLLAGTDGDEQPIPETDLLLLSSYPLHPPGKPERARVDHLPAITVPTVIVHGSSDPFATTAEITDAAGLFGGPVRLVEIDRAGHDLKPDKRPTAPLTADAVEELLF